MVEEKSKRSTKVLDETWKNGNFGISFFLKVWATVLDKGQAITHISSNSIMIFNVFKHVEGD